MPSFPLVGPHFICGLSVCLFAEVNPIAVNVAEERSARGLARSGPLAYAARLLAEAAEQIIDTELLKYFLCDRAILKEDFSVCTEPRVAVSFSRPAIPVIINVKTNIF